MRRHFPFVLSILWLAVTAGPAYAAAPNAAALRVGDMLPKVSGATLSGGPLTLPAAAVGKPTVLVFSFSRAAAADDRVWDEHLAGDFSGAVPTYAVLLLESAPRLFRGMAIAGIRSGTAVSVQHRTLLLCREEKLWKQRLAVSDEGRPYLVLVGPRGHVRWMDSGRFTEVEYARLKAAISGLR